MVAVEHGYREIALPSAGAEPADGVEGIDAAIDVSEVPLKASSESHAAVRRFRHE